MRADVRGTTNPDPVTGQRSPTTSRRWGGVLLAASVWNVWLWITRTYNLTTDPTPRTTGFVVVHAVLYAVSFGFAIAIGVIGWRLWREARSQRT